MSIRLGGYSFRGPYKTTSEIKNLSGIYAVIREINGEYFLYDVGESCELRTAIESNNAIYLKKNSIGKIALYVRYTPFLTFQKRTMIERKLNEIFQPPWRRYRLESNSRLIPSNNNFIRN